MKEENKCQMCQSIIQIITQNQNYSNKIPHNCYEKPGNSLVDHAAAALGLGTSWGNLECSQQQKIVILRVQDWDWNLISITGSSHSEELVKL